jgi:glycosyltransferase involved in cell wall biosynthesis
MGMEPLNLGGERLENGIRVGLTTIHGMLDEQLQHPPEGVKFEQARVEPKPSWIRSPLKCYLYSVPDCELDLIEAVLAPIKTRMPWVCSMDCYQSALAFSILGAPTPKWIRRVFVESLLKKANCKKIVFWSEAALKTLTGYGRVTSPEIIGKAMVIYPAIRFVDNPREISQVSDRPFQFLFSGDFFRKGGVNVVDAFERLLQKHPNLVLRICAGENDFHTDDQQLKSEYLHRIRSNERIVFGRVSRDEMIDTVLPQSNALLLPTYAEAFGFAILEAMSFGIPVISTNVFAIPEIISHDHDGLLIDVSRYPTDRLFRGYRVNSIPRDFRNDVTNQLYGYMERLVESSELGKRLGEEARRTVRTKFSFDRRNRMLAKVYQDALVSR